MKPTAPSRLRTRLVAQLLCGALLLELTPAALGIGPPPPSHPPDPPARTERARPATEPQEAATEAATQPGGFALAPGFNLISLPRVPESTDPALVFAPLGSQLESVYAWDHCDPAEAWQVYDPVDLAATSLQAVDYRRGLWVDVATATRFAPGGTRPAVTEIPLCAGWNLIGYPLDEPRPVAAALASIAGQYERVFGFDKADAADPWEVYDPNVPDWANDLEVLQPGRGYWLLATETTVLRLANEGAPPQIAFVAPLDLGEVTAPVDVRAEVSSDLLASWRLSVRPAGEEAWQQLAAGAAPLPSSLATIDPTLLRNGLYQLRLEATDFAGQTSEEIASVVVDGGMKVGNLSLSFLDLSVPLAGLNVEVIRSYDSRDPRPGDFGAGWSLELRRGSLRHNRPPGQGWQILPTSLPCQRVEEGASHLTVVELSDREIYRFRLGVGSPAVAAGGCFAQAHFDFVAGATPGATLEVLGNTRVIYQNGGDQLLDADSLELYQPRQARLRTRDGRVVDLDVAEGVTRLADANGNTLVFTDAGITHDSGTGVTFTRDAAGRIAGLTDPEGSQWQYSYDAAGDLIAATDPLGQVTRFRYGAGHRLQEIKDARGKVALRNEYDAGGRLLRHFDAAGEAIGYQHDLAARREVITDRLGHERVLEYDARGNVVREVDAAGAETLRTYDARDNLLTEGDGLGRITRYTYSAADDLLSVADPLGHLTRFTYDASGRLLTTTDPLGRTSTQVYDGRGNLLQSTNALGQTTTFTVDLRGNRVTETDPLGAVTRYHHDTGGQLLSQTDALGTVTTYTYNRRGDRLTETTARTLADGSTETLTTRQSYDAAGRLTSVTDATGAPTTTRYDALGNLAETVDALGRVTRHSYDDRGLETRIDFADGTHDERSYDAEGRLVAGTDRAGRTTQYAYDATGRLLATTLADGSTSTSTYDAAGQLIASTDARGNTTTNVYDAAGRRTRVRNALGEETSYVYDAAGQQVAVTDARGFTHELSYDALGQRTRTTFPDGTSTETAYDAAGRRIAETDAAGVTTSFGYDALGRLLQVTDALGQVTSYGYDEQGNRIRQTDASGHTTTFAYDAAGRQTQRTLPGGASEHFTYDAAGNLLRRKDFQGQETTYGYDALDRLVHRAYPDGSGVTFTYTPTGQRASATDARGTTLYAYDARNRLTRLTYPDGRELRYAHDATGNRTELTADLGQGIAYTTKYSYDALNRLQAVTDPQGRSYPHRYDANGNRAALGYPNGLETRYQYDALNRLSLLATSNATGETVQSYAYTVGPTGNRQAIHEHDGTARSYGYDTLYRLIDEQVQGGTNPSYRNAFTYDSIGNRQTQQRTDAEGVTQAITYTYDSRDRLQTEDATRYGWDENGNLTSRAGPDGALYRWDYENRLIGVDRPDGTRVDHVYDADGVRVRTTVTAPDGTQQVTSFLVDTSGVLSHVVAETDATGNLQALYIRGIDLLASLRPGTGQRYYHTDGLGSVRALSHSAGAVTDRYAFEAFGTLASHEGTDEQAYAFAGEPLDPNSGFYYLRARWMDVGVGRFASADTFAGCHFEPVTLHRYLYANVSPADYVDPSGSTSSLADLMSSLRVMATTVTRVTTRMLSRNTSFGRFFWNNRAFRSISRAYWRKYGPASGRSLHHWLFPQRARYIPQGLRNAGFNLLEMPKILPGNLSLNSFMGFAVRWGGYRYVLAGFTEQGIRFVVLLSAYYSGKAGYEVGEAIRGFSLDNLIEELEDSADLLNPELGL